MRDAKAAFFGALERVEPAERVYLSLYVNVPFYGGPEEGGWWGTDTYLVAYQAFSTRTSAEQAMARVEHEARRLDTEEVRRYGEQCLREMEWCEARGLDADYLPEPDGPSSYFVVIEDRPGQGEHCDDRHYS